MSEEIDLSQFHAVFFEEAGEHLEAMEELLLALDMEDPDDEELNAIFRSAHSIKGSAGTFGFMKVQDVTHVLESILDRIRNKTTEINNERTDLFLEAGDILKDLIAAHEAEEDIDEDSANSIIERLQADLDSETNKDGKKPESSEPSPQQSDGSEPPGNFGFFGDDEPEPLANNGSEPGDFGMFGSDEPEVEPLANNGSEPGDFGMFPSEEPEVQQVIEPEVVKQEAPKAEEAPKPKPKPKPKAKKPKADKKNAKPQAEKTIRVGVEKIDQLVNAIGEMVITQSVISLLAGMDSDRVNSHVDDFSIDVGKLHESIHTLQRNVKDLQETIMSIRMVPISSVFNRFPRLVRDMATKLGKDIDLVIEGEATELDKGLIEKLSDPLTHILRNSIDHGIEERAERAETGKVQMATVKISAAQIGGNIVIQITDDGRGLNKEKIVSKAKSSGMTIPADMPDSEIWLLIFAPGFSTADKVSELSGRGVGMDVVKKNIAGLGGRVELESKGGEGTKLTIYLPLTMAILNGMIIKDQGVNYIIPMLSIIETVRPETSRIEKLGGGSSKVMYIRGEHVPIVDLCAIFRLDKKTNIKFKEASRDTEYYANKIMMLVEAEDRKALLVVDELAGQQQVVIKNIEDNYRKVTGISGATILGDGNIALIVDINYFVGLTNNDLLLLEKEREKNDKISETTKKGAI